MACPKKHTANDTHASRVIQRIVLLCLVIVAPQIAVADSVTHTLTVKLRPDRGEIHVSDTLTLSAPQPYFEFILNSGLKPTADNASLVATGTSADGLRTRYRVSPATPTRTIEVRYQGQPRFSPSVRMGGMPQGEVSAEGVYLDGASAWYPVSDSPIARLDMQVEAPEGWQSVSIGKRSLEGQRQRWRSNVTHDELYLIAAPFHRYATSHKGIDLSVWLLEDDPELAGHYLSVMGGYIDRYSALLGAYPFAKFAVVENRWQTGFGMPSFTLLGSRVIRLPFIPYTSLPHEILHNWLGNGIWVDYEKGNWSEGLTAYLADHWMKERRGQGAQYRLQALQRYSNFAASGEDTPLRQFVSRHDDASQSIGYSKSLMLFHMIRRALGDQAFVTGLQRLWKEQHFQRIGFDAALSTLLAERRDLLTMARQWLNRTGAPRLRLSNVTVDQDKNSKPFRLSMMIEQQESPFAFDLPVAVTLQGQDEAVVLNLRIDKPRNPITLRFRERPLRVDLDPEYDVLRYLDASEQPPALNRLFSQASWLILPTTATSDDYAAWRQLVAHWQKRYPKLRAIDDTERQNIPEADNRILLGWENLALGEHAPSLSRADQQLSGNSVTVGQHSYSADDAAVVLSNTDSNGTTSGFIGAQGAQAIAQLARKLPHYGSYARLIFDHDGKSNLVKQTLLSEHSKLSRQLSDERVGLNLPTRPGLNAPHSALSDKNRVH